MRRFYLSIVYDANGYDRLDLENKDSLMELDNLISKYKNRNEVFDKYLSEYNIDKKKGKVCIIYEDLDIKNKQRDRFNKLSEEDKERFKNSFTYAHIIPIMYNKRKLLSIKECINILKKSLYKREIHDSIMHDKETKDGQKLKTNKRYLFETEEEQDYLYNLRDYHTAVALFLRRIAKEKPENQYLYCRSLIDVCNLGLSLVKTRKGKIKIRDGNLEKNSKNTFELTKSEILEQESEDMESFYLYNDLDDVIKYSPNMNRPIGSVGKRLK